MRKLLLAGVSLLLFSYPAVASEWFVGSFELPGLGPRFDPCAPSETSPAEFYEKTESAKIVEQGNQVIVTGIGITGLDFTVVFLKTLNDCRSYQQAIIQHHDEATKQHDKEMQKYR